MPSETPKHSEVKRYWCQGPADDLDSCFEAFDHSVARGTTQLHQWSHQTVRQVIAVVFGHGVDHHGQDPTHASVHAVENALLHAELPAALSVVPGGFDNVKCKVKIAVPYCKLVDREKYGKVSVKVVRGGLRSHTCLVLPQAGDPARPEEVVGDTSGSEMEEEPAGKRARDEAFVANVAIRVGY
eukprot:jgi/Astpho2/1338/Aster-x0999